jgi:hypothetical protein
MKNMNLIITMAVLSVLLFGIMAFVPPDPAPANHTHSIAAFKTVDSPNAQLVILDRLGEIMPPSSIVAEGV